MSLTGKQRTFADSYLDASNKTTLNSGLESARAAGYKGNDRTLTVVAGQNLTKIDIISYMDEKRAVSAKKAELTIQSVLENIAWGIRKAVEKDDLPALARLSELQGKYLSMWSEQGNNAASGLSLNFTTRPSEGPTIVKLRKEA